MRKGWREIFKTAYAAADRQKSQRAVGIVVTGTLVLLLFLLHLLGSLTLQTRNGSSVALVAEPLALSSASTTAANELVPQSVPTVQAEASVTTRESLAKQQVLVYINDTMITLHDLLQTTALNHVIQHLLDQPTQVNPQVEFERLINSQIVEQAAIDADFQLSAKQYTQAFNRWLTSHQQTEATLQTALQEKGFTLDEFSAYFRRLLITDRFLAEQGQRQEQSLEELLRAWQQQTRISFGPAAQVYLSADQATLAVSQPQSLPTTVMGNQSAAAPTATAQPPANTQFALLDGVQADELLQSTNENSSTMHPIATISDTHIGQPASAMTEPTQAPVGLAPGNRAPTFTLALLDAEFQTNLSTWQGRPIVLSFWTTWCPYCRKQTPVLVAADQLTTTGHVQFIGVNVNESQSVVRPYIETHQIPYPILLDADGDIASLYAVRGYPTTYFIDATGHIVTKHVGALDEIQLAQYLSQFNP